MTIPLPQASTRGVHRTNIEWADYAVGSPFRFRDRGTGEVLANACVKLSSGCAHCYAEAIGQRFGNARPYTKANMDRLECVIDDSVIRSVLTFRPKPVKGEATYKNGRTRPLLFMGDMTDVFGEWVPDHLLDRVMAAVALRPDVDVIVLTKRAGRMREYMKSPGEDAFGEACSRERAVNCAAMRIEHLRGREAAYFSWPLPNLWLGVSVEDQATADERIPHLLACPAAVRVVSAEPLLGPVDLTRINLGNGDTGDCLNHTATDIWRDGGDQPRNWGRIHNVIIGGESGPGARPCNVEHIRSLVRQGAESQTATFTKQLGSNVIIDASIGLRVHLHDRKGGDPSEWPAHLRVRQMPGAEGGGR